MSSDWASEEMAGAQVGDRRMVRGLGRVCAALAARPQASFSAACGPAGRQVAARCFRRADTTVPRLLSGHYQQTARRAAARPLLLVAQDTTDLDFSAHPATQGLGPIDRYPRRQGLLAHTALALTPEGEPLGLLHLELWARDPDARGTAADRRRRATADKESAKWDTGRRRVEAVLPETQEVLLLQDREGDVFAFLAAPRRPRTHLLIRAAQARKVRLPQASGASGASGTLFAVASGAPVLGTLSVTLPAKRNAPTRETRTAHLQLQALQVEVQPPRHAPAGEPRTPQRVWVVRAVEGEAPAGETPVEWVLVSTLPVTGAEGAATLVRYYALRWRIERLHYTLKSGCQVEQLQHDTAATLRKAVALYYVVAWRLLWLTYRARVAPEQPWTPLFDAAEVAVLQRQSRRPPQNLQEAVRAIAALAGWRGYRSAPDPGVKMLWLGLQRLQDMSQGWRLAQDQPPDPIQA